MYLSDACPGVGCGCSSSAVTIGIRIGLTNLRKWFPLGRQEDIKLYDEYYRDNTACDEVQQLLPTEYRWQDGFGPEEEYRPWRGSPVHVERFPNPDASHKVILLAVRH